MTDWRVVKIVNGDETAAVVAGELVLTTPAGDGAQIFVDHMNLLPAGDFDVEIEVTDTITTDEVICYLYVADKLAAPGTFGTNVVCVRGYLNGASADFDFFRYKATVYGVLESQDSVGQADACKLRIRKVGNTFYGYYDIGAGWVAFTASYTDAAVAAAVDRVRLSSREAGNDATVSKWDNLKFNKSQCPDGSQWSTTTTTSSTTCSTCSTLSTEPPP